MHGDICCSKTNLHNNEMVRLKQHCLKFQDILDLKRFPSENHNNYYTENMCEMTLKI